MRCRCGGESSAAGAAAEAGRRCDNANVKFGGGGSAGTGTFGCSNNHLPGGLEPLRGCTALLRQRTREVPQTLHTQSGDTRMCRLCTPPRAVECGAWPRVPPVGWLRGGRGSNARRTASSKADKNVWGSAPNPPQTPKVRVLLFIRVLKL